MGFLRRLVRADARVEVDDRERHPDDEGVTVGALLRTAGGEGGQHGERGQVPRHAPRHSPASSFRFARIDSACSGVMPLMSSARRRRWIASSSGAAVWKSPSCGCRSEPLPLSDGRPPRDSSSRSSPFRISRARRTTHRRQARPAGRPGCRSSDPTARGRPCGGTRCRRSTRGRRRESWRRRAARRRDRSARGSASRRWSWAGPGGSTPGARRPPTRG